MATSKSRPITFIADENTQKYLEELREGSGLTQTAIIKLAIEEKARRKRKEEAGD